MDYISLMLGESSQLTRSFETARIVERKVVFCNPNTHEGQLMFWNPAEDITETFEFFLVELENGSCIWTTIDHISNFERPLFRFFMSELE